MLKTKTHSVLDVTPGAAGTEVWAFGNSRLCILCCDGPALFDLQLEAVREVADNFFAPRPPKVAFCRQKRVGMQRKEQCCDSSTIFLCESRLTICVTSRDAESEKN